MLRGFEHDGRRWMEGSFEGRFFALDEDGERLMVETPIYGFRCFEGETTRKADAFHGTCVGVTDSGQSAFAWLHGDPLVDLARIMAGTASTITVALGDGDAAQTE